MELLDLFGILVALLCIIAAWIKWSQTYWNRRGLVTPPVTFLFGNTFGVFTQTEGIVDFMSNLYTFFKKKGEPCGGIYFLTLPMVLAVGPDMIRNIMIADAQHFYDRPVYYNEKDDPLSANLLALEGERWKNLRSKLTPTFTSGKLKNMFHILLQCGNQLTEEMDKFVGTKDVEVQDILARFTTDIIGNCAFGIECNSLKNPNNDFNKYGRNVLKKNLRENMVSFLQLMFPNLMKMLGSVAFRPELSNFFMNVVRETVHYREKDHIIRKDFMHLLLQLKNHGKLDDNDDISQITDGNSGDKLTLNEIAAQAFVFYVGGFETSSTTMAFALYELTSNPEIQEKLREEILEVIAKHNGEISYEAVTEMGYLDKVVQETLRKHPPLPATNRRVTKEYKIPGMDVTLEKGTQVFIPTVALHRDEEYYPDPLKFDPERFSEENKKKRPPMTYMPFGEGPRICIGSRFGLMQTKVGLCILLKNYRFRFSPKMQLPLKLDMQSFIMTPASGVWLTYTKV